MSASSARPVPNIYSGVETEEEKRRARSQQAMYRRLFMDIEREQVKENIRRQEHRKRIQRYRFYPNVTIGLCYPYHLDKSISIFWASGVIFHFLMNLL